MNRIANVMLFLPLLYSSFTHTHTYTHTRARVHARSRVPRKPFVFEIFLLSLGRTIIWRECRKRSVCNARLCFFYSFNDIFLMYHVLFSIDNFFFSLVSYFSSYIFSLNIIVIHNDSHRTYFFFYIYVYYTYNLIRIFYRYTLVYVYIIYINMYTF